MVQNYTDNIIQYDPEYLNILTIEGDNLITLYSQNSNDFEVFNLPNTGIIQLLKPPNLSMNSSCNNDKYTPFGNPNDDLEVVFENSQVTKNVVVNIYTMKIIKPWIL